MDEQPFFTVRDDPEETKAGNSKKYLRAKPGGADVAYWIESQDKLEAYADLSGFNHGSVFRKGNQYRDREDTVIEPVVGDATQKNTIKAMNNIAVTQNLAYKQAKQKLWHHLRACCSDRMWSRVQAAGENNGNNICDAAKAAADIGWLYARIHEVCRAINSTTVNANDPAYINARMKHSSDAWNHVAQKHDQDFPAYLEVFKNVLSEYEDVHACDVDETVAVVRLYEALKRPYYDAFVSQSAVLGYPLTIDEAERKISEAVISNDSKLAHVNAAPSEIKQAAAYAFNHGKPSQSKGDKKPWQNKSGDKSSNRENNRYNRIGQQQPFKRNANEGSRRQKLRNKGGGDLEKAKQNKRYRNRESDDSEHDSSNDRNSRRKKPSSYKSNVYHSSQVEELDDEDNNPVFQEEPNSASRKRKVIFAGQTSRVSGSRRDKLAKKSEANELD
jgi:hypothetical protein